MRKRRASRLQTETKPSPPGPTPCLETRSSFGPSLESGQADKTDAGQGSTEQETDRYTNAKPCSPDEVTRTMMSGSNENSPGMPRSRQV